MPKPLSAAKRQNPRLSATTTVRLNAYAIISRAVEEGIAYGIGRLWKYNTGDTMTEDYMREHQDRIYDAVMNDLCEVLEFRDE
jgi:hypothetical protein